MQKNIVVIFCTIDFKRTKAYYKLMILFSENNFIGIKALTIDDMLSLSLAKRFFFSLDKRS